jgi:hypothetical protein
MALPPFLGNDRSSRPASRGLAVLVLFLLGLLVAGCSPTQIDEGRAVQIARDFVVQGQPSDVVFVDLTNDPPKDIGGNWQVKVDATVRIPSGGASQLHFIIQVDRTNGAATIVAQG